MVRSIATALTILALLAAGAPLRAENSSSPMVVTATVEASCVLATANLDFGNYSVWEGTALTATTNVTVKCTPDTAWSLAADAGSGGGTFAERRMALGAGQLAYNLFVDGGHTQTWGDGTGGTATIAGTGSGANQVQTIYCRIPAGQVVAPGTYSDTVIVTVSY